MNYYKRHIGDYAKKAGHLSVLEHGVYTLLLDAYYDREQAPTRAEALRQARARTPEEIAAVDAVLADFFSLSADGRYTQQRVEEEFAKAEAVARLNAAKGKLGGRPRKTKGKLKESRRLSEAKPSESPEKPNPLIHQSTKEPEQKTAPAGDLLEGISPQVAADFKALRSKLRAPITATAMNGIRREAAAAGLGLEAALVMCCERGWRGFKAAWLDAPARAGPATTPSKQTIGLAGFLGVDPHDLHNERAAGTVVHEADRPVSRGPLLAGPGGRAGGGEH